MARDPSGPNLGAGREPLRGRTLRGRRQYNRSVAPGARCGSAPMPRIRHRCFELSIFAVPDGRPERVARASPRRRLGDRALSGTTVQRSIKLPDAPSHGRIPLEVDNGGVHESGTATRGTPNGARLRCWLPARCSPAAVPEPSKTLWPEQEPTYKTSRSAPPLEMPPDVTSAAVRDSLPIPGVDATYSQYASGETDAAGPGAAAAVLPEVEDARVERSGDQRWLVVAMKPDEIWPRLRDFWTAQGFILETEEPDVGVMETEWAARHNPLPAGAHQAGAACRASDSPLRGDVPRPVPDPDRARSRDRHHRRPHLAPRCRADGGRRRDRARAARRPR